MRGSSALVVPIETYEISDVFWALTVLCNLTSLTRAAEDKPSGPEKRLIENTIWVARIHYRQMNCATFIQTINEYESTLNMGGDTLEMSAVVAHMARKLRSPQLQQGLPWYVAFLLVLIGGLSVASIPLIATGRGCCSATQSVAIALNAVAIALVIIVFPIIYCAQRRGVEKNLDRATREIIYTSAHGGHKADPVRAPLTMTVADPEAKAAELTDGFMLDWDAAMRRKRAATSVLAEATEEDGSAVLRARGFPACLVSLAAINKHTIIILTDREGEVVLWSEGAAANCGFSARDAEGKNINSLLYGEKSVQLYATMTEAAEKNLDISEKILTLAHLTLGSISVSASVVMARDAENGAAIGYALIGSVRSDELSRMQSLFHNFFVAELTQLRIRDPQFRQIVDCLQWKNLRDLSALARDWGNAHVRRLLAEVIKGRQNQVDVEVDPKVTELPQIMCDTLGVSAVLTKAFELFPGKIRIRVEQRRITDAIYQLIVTCQHDTAQINRDLLLSVGQSANNLGGLVVGTGDTLKIQLPFMVKDDAIQALRPQGTLMDKESNHDPLIVLLLEKNAVYRHNISTVVWNCGHSLRVVDNARQALTAIEESTDLGCAIIDVDVKEADRIIDALQRKSIHTIETSEAPNADARCGECLLKKPISATALQKELDKATEKNEEAKRADEELVRQREVFGTVRNSPWTLGRLLGKGAFATVYEATSTLTGGIMAVKIINVESFESRIPDLMNEIKILCQLTHPNIIHYFYCERTESTLNLFMALADQGSVEDLLKKCPRLPENHVATILKQLLQAVNYLHECDVIHRDIKPGNMLISQGQLKLSDFGTATTTTLEGMVGTPYYMAPEVINGQESGKESDVWSVGCVVCKCLQIDRPGGLLGYDAPESFPDHVSPQCIDFIQSCMKVNPAERATAGTLLLHDFIVHIDHEVAQLAEPPARAADNKDDDALSIGSSDDSSKVSWSL